VFSPESVVDNATNGALTLRVGSIKRPCSHRPHACTGRPAGGVRHNAVSTSSKVARNSLASFDENTSGERIFRICPSFPVALISTSRRPALMTFQNRMGHGEGRGLPPKVLK